MGTDNDNKPAPEKLELPTEEPNVKVNLDEDDDEGDRGGDSGRRDDDGVSDRPADVEARARDPKTGKWTQKKQERGQNHREQRSWERERADYDRRFRMMQEEHDRRFNEIRNELERSRQQSSGGQPSDPFTARLRDIDFQLDTELARIESGESRDYARYRYLNDQRVALITQRELAAHAAETQRQQQNQPEDRYAARRPIIEAEFPWVMERQYSELARRAKSYKDYLVNFMGKPDNLDTDREALSHTVAQHGGEFGMRPPPVAPSMRTRQMYASPASRTGPDRNGRPREVELPNELVRGSGLDAAALRRAVNNALNDEN